MVTKDTLTHQVQLSSKYYKILRDMFDRLDVRMSDNYNSLYGRDDLLGVLICMSDGNRFAASATARMGLAAACSSADGAGDGRVPSPSWVLKTLRDVDRTPSGRQGFGHGIYDRHAVSGMNLEAT